MANPIKNETNKDDVPKLPIELKYFYTVSVLMSGIMDTIEETFKKEFDDRDIMNVSMLLLHSIICTNSDEERENVKSNICEIIDDKYKLNEFLFEKAGGIKAFDETFYNALVTGDIDDLDDKLEKAVERAEYKAWIEESKVINHYDSFKDRYNAVMNS